MTEPTVRYLLVRLWHHLRESRRRQITFLAPLMVLSAFAEVISVGAVVPFIGVLSSPDQVLKYRAVSAFGDYWGVTSPGDLILPLTFIFAIAAVSAGMLRIFVSWLSTRVTFAAGVDLSIEVYRRTLYQPYSTHVMRSSSETIAGITGKVGATTLGVILPVLTLISSAVILVSIMAALIFIQPIVAIVATLSFSACYGLVTWAAQRRLRRNSKLIAEEQTKVVKALQEGLGGIRDILLDGTQPIYCDVYRRADKRWRLAQGENVFIGQSPRFAIEAVGMVLIALLALSLSKKPGGLSEALPVIGALAVGAQRLLPVMQQTYAAWTSIRGNRASFADTISLLDQPLRDEITKAVSAPLAFDRSITFENLSFRYSKNSPWVLKHIDLVIDKGARVGFVGPTGSGKSTLVDVLMGLLEPTRGRMLVDERQITHDCVRAWQKTIAHVPQNIFIADTTLAENIALGIHPDEIDEERLRLVARQAQIEELFQRSPDAFDTFVGERGVRLSGGQRQRIGIARALYKRASVLILDEATSALDNKTEQSVIQAIEQLDRDLTILMIAHRLTTLKYCDSIIHLEGGEVVAKGSFKDLAEANADLSLGNA